MGSLNRATIIGNLCAKPELRHTTGGMAVTELRVATNRAWTDKQGAKQEEAEFHRVVCWNKTAENCCKYLDRGKQVYVEGRLKTREWQDKDNNRRWTTEIIADQVTFLGTRGESTADQLDDSTPTGNGTVAPTTSTTAPTVDDSDIPF